jgi:hypothetical protein
MLCKIHLEIHMHTDLTVFLSDTVSRSQTVSHCLSHPLSLSLSFSLSLSPYLLLSNNRRLLDLLESRAESSDSRLTTIRAKKFPNETFPPIVSKPLTLIFPPPALCTDNGVMVAWAGIEKINLGISDSIDGQVRRTD